MKKLFLTLAVSTAFALSNAMENQHQADQNKSIRHYTLAHLQNQQGNQDTFQQQPDHSNIDPVQLAFFGLQQGDNFTAHELLDRYHNGLELLTPGQVSERHRAFSTLYPHARRDQQQEATFFNQNTYDYRNYYLPEPSAPHARADEAMEIDEAMEPNYLESVGNLSDRNAGSNLFENIAPYHRPDDAIVSSNDLDQRLNQQHETIQNHLMPPHYNLLPLNVWLPDNNNPIELIINARQQTSQTVQSNSDNPDEQRVIGGYDTAQEVRRWLIPVVMFTRSPDGTLIQRNARYKATHRRRIIDRHANHAHNNDGQNNDNDGSGATGTGN